MAEQDGRSRKPVVALLLDYDGCGDIISPTNTKWQTGNASGNVFQQNFAGYLNRFLDKYASTADNEVIVFVGSNRQDVHTDDFNAFRNRNGKALGTGEGFELLAADRKWKLDKTLIADGHRRRTKHGSAWNDDGKNMPDLHDTEIGWSSQVKIALTNNVMKRLKELYPGRSDITVYFIDDQQEYLDNLREMSQVPNEYDFYTVLFFPFSYQKGYNLHRNRWTSPELTPAELTPVQRKKTLTPVQRKKTKSGMTKMKGWVLRNRTQNHS